MLKIRSHELINSRNNVEWISHWIETERLYKEYVITSLLLYLHTLLPDYHEYLHFGRMLGDYYDLLSTNDESQRHSFTLSSFSSATHKLEVVARKNIAFGTTLGFWFVFSM